jgi:hypothetical protein
MRKPSLALAACLAWCLGFVGTPAQSADPFPTFTPRVIDPHAGEVVYALTSADVDDDGKLDIVALTENAVLWYQAPDWKRRVIMQDQVQRDHVCIAPHDITGDGKVDFAIGAGWLNGRNLGTLHWLERGESLDDPWRVHTIGAIPWTHRMRWADVLGTGQPQLVVSPLNKTQGGGVELTAFSIPKNPRQDRWPPTILDATLNRMHNHWHTEDATLTASEEGAHRISLRDGEFMKQKVAGSQGSGEIKNGSLGKDRPFIVTIEPMHGTSVVVYAEKSSDEAPKRIVLDDTLGRGHALWTADIDRDGADEIIVGHSDPASGAIKGPGVYVYDSQDGFDSWTKHVIDDGGVATEDLIVADFTGDGLLDIVAGGRATHNVKLYIQEKSP